MILILVPNQSHKPAFRNRNEGLRMVTTNEDPLPPRDKKSIWNWKKLKAFSNDKSRKFTCRFSLQVHSIEDLPVSFKELSLCVHWKRRDEDLVTHPVKVFDGTAEFEEKFRVTCSVYGTKGGPHNSVKYEVKHCMLYASVFGAPDLYLGKHQVDLTRFLPLTWEELEEEKSSGEWTTSFKLSGKAKGAIMNVTFGYMVLSDIKRNRKTGTKFGNAYRKPTMRAVESLPCLADIASLSHLLEETEDLHHILPASKSDTDDANMVDQKFDEYKSGDASIASKPKPDLLTEHFEPTIPPSSVASSQEQIWLEEGSMVPAVSKVENNQVFQIKPSTSVNSEESYDLCPLNEVSCVNQESNQVFEINPGTCVNSEESYELRPLNEVSRVNREDMLVVQDCNSKVDDQSSKESLMRELELALNGITNLEAALDSSDSEDLEDYMEHNANYETNRKSSVSLDEVTESVASEFLSMLGIDHSPFSSSSESEHESPRGRLLRQFEEETLAGGCSLFDFGMADGEEIECGSDISTSSNLSGVSDMPFVVQDDLQEHQMESNGRIKVRAEVLEDLETEALMKRFSSSQSECSKPYYHIPQ